MICSPDCVSAAGSIYIKPGPVAITALMFMEALEASSASGRGGGIMKFIHTGDVHWGMTPDADKPWGKERAQAIRDTFKAIIDHAAQ